MKERKNSTEKLVLQLYMEGKSVADIADKIGKTESTVYTYLSRNGKPQRSKNRAQGISTWRITQARNKAQVGKWIRVKSVKRLMFGEGNIKLGGVPVMARVLSKASKHFCLVELPGGTQECILWTDMVGESMDRY
ncbi:sigma factor-like helix-turn-helix DNA-binding protein [Clostridium sp. AM42-4]|uniref:sigma factor-like helix-turn-helix DNA-binding protein n=1 Tax=Clostridium sp. AM42-4 TaxID=2292305 RepID=UPI000E543A7C|nr:sigma factor-like helix-turn-helix DNA-binding protein [Clostridium sp. AM42-4]RHS85485.1 hypothetical protein DW922_11475 [Clostridium sp. AM42-4]